MDSYDMGRLTYLVLLGVAVAGYFIAENRDSLGKVARQAIVWGLIFLGVIAGFGLWNDIRDDVMARQSVIAATGQIQVPRGVDGHFYLTLRLNDTPVEFVVDTGATDVVLTRQDAARAGIDLQNLNFIGSANTANGTVRTAPARVKTVELGQITDRNLPVFVNGGDMDTSLLGMTYLRRFERIEIAADTLILTR